MLERLGSFRRRVTIALRVTRLLFGKKHMHDGIAIRGDDAFVRATVEALDLLRGQTPDVYALVRRHLGDILASKPTGVLTRPSRFAPTVVMIGPSVSKGSAIEYAGALAHEAYHCELYKSAAASSPDIRVPTSVHSGEEAERQCLRYQCDVLKRLGLDDKRLGQHERKMETRWWEVPFDQREY